MLAWIQKLTLFHCVLRRLKMSQGVNLSVPAAGKAFVLFIKGRPSLCGTVAWMQSLQPDACIGSARAATR